MSDGYRMWYLHEKINRKGEEERRRKRIMRALTRLVRAIDEDEATEYLLCRDHEAWVALCMARIVVEDGG